MPGVRVKKMQTQGMRASGTGYITFEDVKVPVRSREAGPAGGQRATDVTGVCSHLIGKENHGFKAIMYDFNHGARSALSVRGVLGAERLAMRRPRRALHLRCVLQPLRARLP